MKKLLCKTLPEADANEYVSVLFSFVLFFPFGYMIYHAIARNCHVEWLLAIVPCIPTLKWKCLFPCASSNFTQNEQLWGDFLSENPLTSELVFISWSKLLCLWDIIHILFLWKAKDVGRHWRLWVEGGSMLFFSWDNSRVFFPDFNWVLLSMPSFW